MYYYEERSGARAITVFKMWGSVNRNVALIFIIQMQVYRLSLSLSTLTRHEFSHTSPSGYICGKLFCALTDVAPCRQKKIEESLQFAADWLNGTWCGIYITFLVTFLNWHINKLTYKLCKDIRNTSAWTCYSVFMLYK